MEMRTSEIMLDDQFLDYIRNKIYGYEALHENVFVVDKQFLLNCLWRDNELRRLRELRAEYQAVIDGQKIKEEMGL